ncbi:MAG: hypothetical protein WCI27_11140 [Candidatus Omnitrophota bacterium]
MRANGWYVIFSCLIVGVFCALLSISAKTVASSEDAVSKMTWIDESYKAIYTSGKWETIICDRLSGFKENIALKWCSWFSATASIPRCENGKGTFCSNERSYLNCYLEYSDGRQIHSFDELKVALSPVFSFQQAVSLVMFLPGELEPDGQVMVLPDGFLVKVRQKNEYGSLEMLYKVSRSGNVAKVACETIIWTNLAYKVMYAESLGEVITYGRFAGLPDPERVVEKSCNGTVYTPDPMDCLGEDRSLHCRSYCIEYPDGKGIRTLEDLKRYLVPVISSKRAVSLVALTRPDLYVGGRVRKIFDGFLVQLYEANSFICRAKTPTMVIYHVSISGEVEKVGFEVNPDDTSKEPCE